MGRGRPQKNGLDYFPLDVDWSKDDKLLLLRARHGPIATLMYVCLLSDIYSVGCCYRWGNDEAEAFALRHGFDRAEVARIASEMVGLKLFDAAVLEHEGFLTSKGIQRRYAEICKSAKRVSAKVPKGVWLLDPSLPHTPTPIESIKGNLGNRDPIKFLNKEKESKVKEIPQKSEEIPQNSELCGISPEEIPQKSVHTLSPPAKAQIVSSDPRADSGNSNNPAERQAIELSPIPDMRRGNNRGVSAILNNRDNAVLTAALEAMSRDDQDKLVELTKAHFETPKDQPWAQNSVFINTGRQPLKKYPLIWITPLGLFQVLKVLHESLPPTHHKLVFLACQSRIEGAMATGRRPETCDAQSWLLSFCLSQVLEQFNQELKVEANVRRRGNGQRHS